MSPCNTAAEFEIKRDEILKPYTTFKIGGPARFFASFKHRNDLREALAFRRSERLDLFVLGGGSNILVSDNGFPGLVLHPALTGTVVDAEDSESVTLGVEAAETWDVVVAHAVEHGWWGIENLSHIPGQAGAALVQNIGAYGQQISDVFLAAEVASVETGATRWLRSNECALGYRSSIFNTTHRGRFVILRLSLRLRKEGEPNLRYPDVRAYFERRGVGQPELHAIRQAIIYIRDQKFPFPREERGGNAGSFFKNLRLNPAERELLESKVASNFGPQVRERLCGLARKFAASGLTKVPAAFLIEICGLKGYRVGGAKVNENQPLVLLNEGGAMAADVLNLAGHIRRTVNAKTGMVLALEPELVGFSEAEITRYLEIK